jgi:hypothetical protein
LVFSTSDIRDVHVVGGGAEIFVFLLSKDLFCQTQQEKQLRYVNSDQVDFGVTVLASFGSTHVNDLK